LKEGNVRARNLHLLLSYFGDEGYASSDPIQFSIPAKEEEKLAEIAASSMAPKVMICLGSNWKNKRLKEETAIAFLQKVDRELTPTFFFVYGNEREKAESAELASYFPTAQLLEKMSLPLWQNVMGAMDLVISVDSAALHLCGTTVTPSFSIFGPSSSLCYKPSGEQHTAFQGRCPYGQQFDKRCKLLRTCETGACIREVSADELFESFQRFWTSVSKSIPCSTT